ncbi:MAG TPA: LPS export ABC transporter permease LptF [Nitrospirota bacterium]|nr:LPS export ABC transporter permease LptF [Nitrospirota bacterium]
MLRTLDRYILRELMPPFFLTMAVLMLVLFLQKLFRLADLVVSKNAALLDTAKVLLFVMPSFLVITLPMSLLVAALTTFATLSSDSEITAMKASRISLYAMIRPVFLLSVLVFCATAATSLVLVPGANAALKAHVFNMVRTSAMVGIEPGVFNTTFDGMVMYVEKMDSVNRLEGVFIADERSAKDPYIIVSKRGNLIADTRNLNVTLALEDGTIHTQPRTETTYDLMGFAAARLYLDISNSLSRRGPPGKSFEDMSSQELLQNIALRKKDGQPAYSLETELNKRLSIPYACFIFGLIGVPLGIRRSRSGKSAGIAIALLVFLLYYVVLAGATNLAETGTVSAYGAFWGPNALITVAAVLFVLKRGREINFLVWDSIVLFYYQVKTRLMNKIRPRKL